MSVKENVIDSVEELTAELQAITCEHERRVAAFDLQERIIKWGIIVLVSSAF